MTAEQLVRAAAEAGATGLSLAPGRRVVLATAAGEREAKGEPLTSGTIDRLLSTMLSTGLRERLTEGRVEWVSKITGLGLVEVRAVLTERGHEVSFAIWPVPEEERPRSWAPRRRPAPAAVAAPRPESARAFRRRVVASLSGFLTWAGSA